MLALVSSSMVHHRGSIASHHVTSHQDHDADLALARRAIEGDRRALNIILGDVGTSMMCAIRAVLGDEARHAEDVLQESLLALVDALPSFRGDCGLRHFGCRIAARIAVRTRRKSRKRREKLRALAAQEAPLSPEVTTPGTMAAAEQRKAILRQLLDELPHAQAETLTLRVILGHSLTDIAATTGVPVNTVRSRLRLAKEALRRRIEHDPEAQELFKAVP